MFIASSSLLILFNKWFQWTDFNQLKNRNNVSSNSKSALIKWGNNLYPRYSVIRTIYPGYGYGLNFIEKSKINKQYYYQNLSRPTEFLNKESIDFVRQRALDTLLRLCCRMTLLFCFHHHPYDDCVFCALCSHRYLSGKTCLQTQYINIT